MCLATCSMSLEKYINIKEGSLYTKGNFDSGHAMKIFPVQQK